MSTVKDYKRDLNAIEIICDAIFDSGTNIALSEIKAVLDHCRCNPISEKEYEDKLGSVLGFGACRKTKLKSDDRKRLIKEYTDITNSDGRIKSTRNVISHVAPYLKSIHDNLRFQRISIVLASYGYIVSASTVEDYYRNPVTREGMFKHNFDKSDKGHKRAKVYDLISKKSPKDLEFIKNCLEIIDKFNSDTDLKTAIRYYETGLELNEKNPTAKNLKYFYHEEPKFPKLIALIDELIISHKL